MNIHIDQQTQQQLFDHALQDHPYECCGILMGQRIADKTYIHRAIEAQNIATENREKNYQIDWRTLIHAVKTSRHDLESNENPGHIVGFYHSHPDGSTQPSAIDRKLAWIDHAYLIISIPTPLHRNDSPTLSSWRLREENSPFIGEHIVCNSPVTDFAQLTS